MLRTPTDPADAALSAVERLYVTTFPASERKPTAWLRSLARPTASAQNLTGQSTLLVAERGPDVVGFAVLFTPPGPTDAALLEYLAVAETERGGGVGGRLFDGVVRAAGRPLLVEVKIDDADAERRRAFYRRGGCREIIGLRYLLPLPGVQPSMAVMVHGVDRLARADLARWLTATYVGAYGQRPDDPRLAAMMAPLDDPLQPSR